MKALLKLVAILALCVFSIAALSGCGKQEPNIVGTYKSQKSESYLIIKKDSERKNYYGITYAFAGNNIKNFFVNIEDTFIYDEQTKILKIDRQLSNEKYFINKDGKELKDENNKVYEKISDKILPFEELNKNNYPIKDSNKK